MEKKVYRSNKGKITVYDKERYFNLMSKGLSQTEKEIIIKEFESIEENVEYEKGQIGRVEVN